jgi:two-component system heavy metal sensor histidine kinase CusS
MLTQEPADGAVREKVVSMIEEVQRLSHIVGQLAFLARADAGQMALNKEAVALDELVRDLADEAAILAAPRRIEVSLQACQPCRVNADRMRLRQLLLNLADNAVKHNRGGGNVRMSLVQEGQHAVFSIRNTGPLLPPEQQARVFERFFRGDTAHGSETEGSGLGLSIAQSIVEAHGGEIRFESGVDGLNRVTVRL